MEASMHQHSLSLCINLNAHQHLLKSAHLKPAYVTQELSVSISLVPGHLILEWRLALYLLLR